MSGGTITRKVYPEEFKREAVRLAAERGSVSEVARELGVSRDLLFRWRRDLEAVPEGEKAFPGPGSARDEELARLRRELARVKEENEILKKAVGIFTHRPS